MAARLASRSALNFYTSPLAPALRLTGAVPANSFSDQTSSSPFTHAAQYDAGSKDLGHFEE